MKLLFCAQCNDVVALREYRRKCSCRKSWGQYIDNINAIIGGKAIPLGFANESLTAALRNQPQHAPGKRFDAFVIEKECPRIEKE